MSLTVKLNNLSVTVPDVTTITLDVGAYFTLTSPIGGTAAISQNIPDAGIGVRGLVNFEDQTLQGVKDFRDGILVGSSTLAFGAIGFYGSSPEFNSHITCAAGPSNRDIITIEARANQLGSGASSTRLVISDQDFRFLFLANGDEEDVTPDIGISTDAGTFLGITGTFEPPVSLTVISGLVVGAEEGSGTPINSLNGVPPDAGGFAISGSSAWSGWGLNWDSAGDGLLNVDLVVGILPLAEGGTGSDNSSITAAKFFASPNTSTGAASWRVMSKEDLPTITTYMPLTYLGPGTAENYVRGVTSSYSQTLLDNNFASLCQKLDRIHQALQDFGLMF